MRKNAICATALAMFLLAALGWIIWWIVHRSSFVSVSSPVVLEDFLGTVNKPVTFSLRVNNIIHDWVTDVPFNSGTSKYVWRTETRGEFDLFAHAKWFLQKRLPGVNIGSSGADTSEIRLVNGDLNSDNRVDEKDLDIVTKSKDPAVADVDGDGDVDKDDIRIV